MDQTQTVILKKWDILFLRNQQSLKVDTLENVNMARNLAVSPNFDAHHVLVRGCSLVFTATITRMLSKMIRGQERALAAIREVLCVLDIQNVFNIMFNNVSYFRERFCPLCCSHPNGLQEAGCNIFCHRIYF